MRVYLSQKSARNIRYLVKQLKRNNATFNRMIMVDYAPNLNEIRQARDKYKTVIQECYEYLNTIKSSRDYYIVQRYISKLEKQLKELEKLLFL